MNWWAVTNLFDYHQQSTWHRHRKDDVVYNGVGFVCCYVNKFVVLDIGVTSYSLDEDKWINVQNLQLTFTSVCLLDSYHVLVYFSWKTNFFTVTLFQSNEAKLLICSAYVYNIWFTTWTFMCEETLKHKTTTPQNHNLHIHTHP